MKNIKDLRGISDPEREIYLNQKVQYHRAQAQSKKIKFSFDRKNRKMFIETIFNNDAEAFDQFLGKLERKNNWAESFKFVREELLRRKINAFKYEAILLIDLLYRFYYPEEI